MSLLSKFRHNLPPKKLEEEIFDYVCDLLNTKRGFGAYQKEFGLGSYLHLNSHTLMQKQIIEDIKQSLKQFEKRIEVIDVTASPGKDLFCLSFTIRCKIQHKPHSFTLAFHPQQNQFNKEIAS